MRINGTKTDPVRLYDTIDLVHETGAALYSHNLIVDQSARQLSPRAIQLRLKVIDSRGLGARTTPRGRRGPIACWHAYRDVIRAILTAHPDATVRTGMALYKTLNGFEWSYHATAYTNVGSQLHPVCMPDLCRCDHDALMADPATIPTNTLEVGDTVRLTASGIIPATLTREIEVGDTVTHEAGWTGTVRKIEGRLFGNRVLTVEEFDGYTTDWLECVFKNSKEGNA